MDEARRDFAGSLCGREKRGAAAGGAPGDFQRLRSADDLEHGALRRAACGRHRPASRQDRFKYRICDEVHSIPIDEARTPLIINGPRTVSTHQYDKWKPLVGQLVRKQNMLCNRLSSDAKELFEKGENEEGGLMLFKVKL